VGHRRQRTADAAQKASPSECPQARSTVAIRLLARPPAALEPDEQPRCEREEPLEEFDLVHLATSACQHKPASFEIANRVCKNIQTSDTQFWNEAIERAIHVQAAHVEITYRQFDQYEIVLLSGA
jgi:hypothetical protein